jgi:hypothetical protein
MVAMRYFWTALLLSATRERCLAQNVTTTTASPSGAKEVKGSLAFKTTTAHCNAMKNSTAKAKEALGSFIGSVTYTKLTVTVSCVAARRLSDRSVRRLTNSKVKLDYSIFVAATSSVTAAQLVANLKGKTTDQWKAFLTDFATKAGISNFTVTDLVVTAPSIVSDDASFASNLLPWTLGSAFAALTGLLFV